MMLSSNCSYSSVSLFKHGGTKVNAVITTRGIHQHLFEHYDTPPHFICVDPLLYMFCKWIKRGKEKGKNRDKNSFMQIVSSYYWYHITKPKIFRASNNPGPRIFQSILYFGKIKYILCFVKIISLCASVMILAPSINTKLNLKSQILNKFKVPQAIIALLLLAMLCLSHRLTSQLVILI